MKLVFAIISDDDRPRLIEKLNEAGFRVTRLHSSGGFLRSGNTTLMSVVETERLQDCLDIIKEYSCSRTAAINANMSPVGMGGSYLPYPVEVQVGGATVFVVNVEQFEQY